MEIKELHISKLTEEKLRHMFTATGGLKASSGSLSATVF